LINRILKLRSQSMPLAEIAQECGLTIGQVKYLLAKKRRTMISHGDNKAWQRDVTRKEAPIQKDWMSLALSSPSILHVSWELTWSRLVMVASYLRAEQQELEKGIRLYDVTGISFNGNNARSWVDIRIEGDTNDCFIPNVQPNCSYVADFGLFHEERFYPILRSETVSTPANAIDRVPAWKHRFRPDTDKLSIQ